MVEDVARAATFPACHTFPCMWQDPCGRTPVIAKQGMAPMCKFASLHGFASASIRSVTLHHDCSTSQ
eukprot:366250-Chlamydomonas_euryale.AAC.3